MNRQVNGNRILAALEPAFRASLLGTCKLVELRPGATLSRLGELTEQVYFVESGLLSVLSGTGNGTAVEVGVIGREGMVGSWLALGSDTALFQTVVQAPGTALRMSSDAFETACAEQRDLRARVLAHCRSFLSMVAETCQAGARLTLEGRLARWLLLAHDRLDRDDLAITHEILSQILGVRRPGVTVALHVLEGERMIKARRGNIKILDRAKLASVAGGLSYAGRA